MIIDDKLGRRGDAVYAALMAVHDGLSEEESQKMNARLVLMLANACGDADTVLNIVKAAGSYKKE